jgi:CheY-like chemotaxis protein
LRNKFVRQARKFLLSYFVRVLIADDEKTFAEVLAGLVRTCGHEVVGVVHSGLDAIRSYRRHKPDVVLMDFSMAKLNGLTACRNILSEDPEGCVLFLSGFGKRTELAPESSGALAVLQKPIDLARLEQVLNEAASRRRLSLGAREAGKSPVAPNPQIGSRS